MRPDRFRLASPGLTALLLALILAGCVTSPNRQADEPPPESPVLEQLGARLPGRYVSVSDSDTERSPQRLEIDRVGGDPRRELVLRLVQRNGADAQPRVFGLRLSATPIATRLRGELALLDGDGGSRRSCPMTFQAGENGLVGETEPGQCVFGEGDEAVGLLKEMAYDGYRLTIGDRLVDPASGQPRGEDRIITFLPQPEYEGWAGRREGDRWRVAQPFALAPGSGTTEPLDAAEMPLGIAVSLDYYRMDRDAGTTLLRLTVLDSDGGQVLGEAWAEPRSNRIGLALPAFQIGLSRVDRPERR